MKLLKFEFALIAGIIAAVCAGVFAADTGEFSGAFIRMHVVANSDSGADQELKLRVRDRALETADALVSGAADAEEAAALLCSNLGAIEDAAAREIRESGFSYAVKAEVTTETFPERDYGAFSLPAGRYRALRLTVGAGAGKNWWCVVYPPLCAASSREDAVIAAKSAGLSDAQIGLITGGGAGVKAKFRVSDFFADIKKRISRS